MKTKTIKSRVLARDFDFFMSPKGGQIYLKDVDRYNAEPKPIAWHESGEPVKATPASFSETCRRWYEQQMEQEERAPTRETRPRYTR